MRVEVDLSLVLQDLIFLTADMVLHLQPTLFPTTSLALSPDLHPAFLLYAPTDILCILTSLFNCVLFLFL